MTKSHLGWFRRHAAEQRRGGDTYYEEKPCDEVTIRMVSTTCRRAEARGQYLLLRGGFTVNKELVIVLDFGGQYNQLVARRVRECNVYCEIYSYKTDLAKIKEMNPKGIILTGGPNSCYEEGAPTYSKELFEMGIPVLGLCYGAQLMMHVLGGKVEKAPVR